MGAGASASGDATNVGSVRVGSGAGNTSSWSTAAGSWGGAFPGGASHALDSATNADNVRAACPTARD